MKKNVCVDLTNTEINNEEVRAYCEKSQQALAYLKEGRDPFAGWVDLPFEITEEELTALEQAASKIKRESQLLVMIGIGGSYLGARAVIEALEPCGQGSSGVKVAFAGNNMSSHYHGKILDLIRKMETSLCVISKSGTTVEAQAAFALLKEAMISKYGEEAASNRIYAITDKEKGVLRQEVREKGYTSFVVPDDVGGRYSVLTPVGLLPIMAAGIDGRQLLAGARKMAEEIFKESELLEYAAARRILDRDRGKCIEIFESYEPRLLSFAEWLKQLFGESEGKEGKGIFPASLCFSTDLHSMGQFLQEGRQCFFETLISVAEEPFDVIIPESAGGMLAGKSLKAINDAALNGVVSAHRAAGVPVIRINVTRLDVETVGALIYFFEMSAAVTCLLDRINPFDQPGVEAYKAEMKKELQREN